ncbi:MAG: hypothetical protein U9R21_04370 [Candidatus Thermoplasmatota archaeon]|nr:hypothetical protein [Candidatus Thermoplasmatota archaeon]
MERLERVIEQYGRWSDLKDYTERIETYVQSDFSQALENAKSLLETICKEICNIKRFADDGNFATLKGERGYYLYNQKLNTHIEIIAFDKIIIDAKQRHKAFFEKLGVDLS